MIQWVPLLGFHPFTVSVESGVETPAPWSGQLVLIISNALVRPVSTVPHTFYPQLGDVITAPASFTMDVPYNWIAAIPLTIDPFVSSVNVYVMGSQFSRNVQP